MKDIYAISHLESCIFVVIVHKPTMSHCLNILILAVAVLMEEAAIVKPILSLIALMEGMVLKILGETIVDKALLVDQKQSARMHRYWKTEKRYSINLDRQMFITKEDALLFGLSYVGFGEERQNVRVELNTSRFKSHFGVEPRTIKDLLVDLKEEFSGGIIYRDLFMTLNWLKLCKDV